MSDNQLRPVSNDTYSLSVLNIPLLRLKVTLDLHALDMFENIVFQSCMRMENILFEQDMVFYECQGTTGDTGKLDFHIYN